MIKEYSPVDHLDSSRVSHSYEPLIAQGYCKANVYDHAASTSRYQENYNEEEFLI